MEGRLPAIGAEDWRQLSDEPGHVTLVLSEVLGEVRVFERFRIAIHRMLSNRVGWGCCVDRLELWSIEIGYAWLVRAAAAWLRVLARWH